MDDTVIDDGDATQEPGPAGQFGRYELLSLLVWAAWARCGERVTHRPTE